jgi:hypothetical protein
MLQVTDILQEFFSSNELSEALQCISDLNAAYFVHEVVRRAFLIALDMSAQEMILFCQLMTELHKSNPTSSQIQSGFRRLWVWFNPLTSGYCTKIIDHKN